MSRQTVTRSSGRLENSANSSSDKAARWKFRGKARRCLRHASTLKRVRLCGHQAQGNMVSLRRGPNGAEYGKVATCGSVWACPVCSARILSERTRTVGDAFTAWESRGGSVGMATLTVRHNRSDSLKDVWGIVGKAWARTTSGRAWVDIKSRIGLAGWMRTTEITHGGNGWHVHLHVLLFVDRDSSAADFQAAGSLLLERWADSVAKLGGSTVAAAQDVRKFVNPDVADLAYFAKAYFGGPDTAALEVTRADLKRGAGRAPFQILEDAMATGLDIGPDWALWREYEKASKSKRMHTWSHGFKDSLGLDEERSDDDIAADETVEEVATVGWITLQDWYRVRANDYLYWGLLEAVERGTEALATWSVANRLKVLPPTAEINFYRFTDVDMPKGYKLG